MPKPLPLRSALLLRSVLLLLPLLAVALGFGPCPQDPPRGARNGFVPELLQRHRSLEYLRYATEEVAAGSILNAIAHMERDLVDPHYRAPVGAVDVEDWNRTWEKFEKLLDTRDFDGLYVLNALLAYEDHPYLTPALWDRIREGLLSFKMWYVDPTPPQPDPDFPERSWDESFYWTENHQILFHVIEYLAGQRFPDECFWIFGLGRTPDCSGPGEMTGEAHHVRAEAKIRRWLDERWEAGFSEWHSNIYMQKSATPLLTLVEHADDPEIRARAAIVLDTLLADLAAQLRQNVLGVTHGRSAMKDKYRGPANDTWGISLLLFGQQGSLSYTSRGDAGATLFARAHRYRLPRVIHEMGSAPGPFVDRTRQSFFLDESAPITPDPVGPPGHGFDDTEANFTFWWGLGAYTVWQVVPLTVINGDRYGLWEASLLSGFKPLRDLLGDPPNIAGGQVLASAIWPLASVGFLKEVNTYTYRTPDYVLSTAQDYRPGANAGQVHAWQATLDAEALVFTTHPMIPATLPSLWTGNDEGEPGYWDGTASMPRSAQVENVGIHVYSPVYADGGVLGFFDYEPLTHAYVPRDQFDEVVESPPWVFARRGDGYLALYSWRDTEWREYPAEELALLENARPVTRSFDLVAPGGPDNVWIVEMGRRHDWGSFEAFRDAVLSATIEVVPRAVPQGHSAFDVSYASPSQGLLEWGSTGPFRVRGEEVALSGYPRVSNPWVEAERGEPVWELEGEHGSLALDWEAGTRTTCRARPAPWWRPHAGCHVMGAEAVAPGPPPWAHAFARRRR